MVSEKDYVFIERSREETSYVKLVGDNEWNGTVFQYGKLSIKEDVDNDMAELSFTYNIIESPLRTEMLDEDENFKNYIGDVLQHIITDALDTGDYKLGTQRTATKNDTEESDNE